MSQPQRVTGWKITKGHIVATDLSAEIAYFLQKRDEVVKIRLAHIAVKKGRKGGGIKAVKIIDNGEVGAIRLHVTEANATQQIVVVTSEKETTIRELAKYVRKNKYILRFR